MREILFKAKRIDNGEWVHWNVYGELCRESGKRTRLSIKKGAITSYYDYIYQVYQIIDKDTICQYTGLKDKNGNKIWENDVCSVNLICDDTEETEKCIVRYGRRAENFKLDLGFYAEWTKTDYLRMDICYWTENREVEVIGNIFDNKDLIGE